MIKKFICRRCLTSYTSENMLKIHKPECENNDTTTIRTSSESHLCWKDRFHKKPLYFRIYADFEAVNEIDIFSIGNKTTKIYKQNPVLSGYLIESELNIILQSGSYKAPSGYNNKDWLVIKLENKMAFYFKNTNKVINMTKKDEKDYRNNNVCRFCEKNFVPAKVRDHSHLTYKYRGPAHSKCKINVTQDKNNFIPFVFHNFSKYDRHMFFEKLVDKKNDKVKFDITPKTNEEYISVTYGCIINIDSCRFLSSSLDSLVKTLVDKSQKTSKDLEEELTDHDEILKIVKEIKLLIKEDKYKNDSIKDLKKDYSDKYEQLEEVLLNYMGENDIKNLKTEFPGKWKYLTKKSI